MMAMTITMIMETVLLLNNVTNGNATASIAILTSTPTITVQDTISSTATTDINNNNTFDAITNDNENNVK